MSKEEFKYLTCENWQEKFKQLKSQIKPSRYTELPIGNYIDYSLSYKSKYNTEYCGDTEWERYCKFINGVLFVIRSGDVDYCYHIYQIADLLKFEHDKLRTEYLPEYECFKVWLEY